VKRRAVFSQFYGRLKVSLFVFDDWGLAVALKTFSYNGKFDECDGQFWHL
jgi:hypothetical protein